MSKPGTRIELPPEAEPARDFFEDLVARYEKRIAELEKQGSSAESVGLNSRATNEKRRFCGVFLGQRVTRKQ